MRHRGGVEDLDPELDEVLQNAHQLEADEVAAMDELDLQIEEADWNWGVGDAPVHQAAELQAGAAQDPNAHEPGEEQQQQQQQPNANAAQPAHPPVHVDQPNQQQKPAEAGTVRWFQENADEKPFAGARYTVMQIIFCALTILAEHSVHQIVFNQFMKLISEVLPEGNHWPRYKCCPSPILIHCALHYTCHITRILTNIHAGATISASRLAEQQIPGGSSTTCAPTSTVVGPS
jgi:hypothetical protein